MSKPIIRHQHLLYFVVLLASWIKPILIPLLLFVVFQGRSNPMEWPPIVYYLILAGFIFHFIGSWLSWKRFTYIRDEQQLIVKSGILFRQVKTIDRNRIHSIQIQQPLIQRLFGIAQVVVETA